MHLFLWLAIADLALSLKRPPPIIGTGMLPGMTSFFMTRDSPSQEYWDNNGSIIPPGEWPWASDPEPPEHDFIQYPQSRVLVAPQYKLAFCYIEKNACTAFASLFNSLNGIWGSEQDDPWWNSTAVSQNISLSEITLENGWKWGVFLRDPSKRYLSAWGSKCLQKEENGWNCRPDADALVNESYDLEFQVSSFEEATRRNHDNQSHTFDNPHWAKQSMFCGGFQDLSRFEFAGILEGDVNLQVRQMLHQANILDMDWLVDMYFPRERVHGHSSHLDQSLFFRNPETLRLTQEMYEDDYRLIRSMKN